MAKKFGKLVLFGVAAGAAAAGIYYYVQTKNKETNNFDEFDKFDDSDPVVRVTSKREYISLDNAKAFVTDTFEKAKDTITKVSKKLGTASENEDEDLEFFDIIEEDVVAEETVAEEPITEAPTENPVEETTTSSASIDDEEDIEEFFDDEES